MGDNVREVDGNSRSKKLEEAEEEEEQEEEEQEGFKLKTCGSSHNGEHTDIYSKFSWKRHNTVAAQQVAALANELKLETNLLVLLRKLSKYRGALSLYLSVSLMPAVTT